ncbi:MAG: MG2 domain-containing protein [Acidobacteriota bacterium]
MGSERQGRSVFAMLVVLLLSMLSSWPLAAQQATIVPDDFLRSWDPLTVFFPRAVGPEGGGPADDVAGLVRVEPAWPGAWTWIDARTLQFRPAEPWPPLERFAIEVPDFGTTARPATLLARPLVTEPAAGAVGVEGARELALTFAKPIAPAALARAVTIELRPLPGLDAAGARWLDARDFEVKALERADSYAVATYVLQLARPLPLGHRVLVHLQRALAPLGGDPAGRVAVLDFATAEPFRAVALGCADARWPLAPGGSVYDAEQVLRCESWPPAVQVDFSAPLTATGPHVAGLLAARNAVRLTPAVDELELEVRGQSLLLRGRFERDVVYRVVLEPPAGLGDADDRDSSARLRDARGRPLTQRARSAIHVVWPARPAFARWDAGHGVVERHGPRQVPLVGRRDARADLRIHRVEPLDLDFWTFPDAPVVVDESQRPPWPGEEPEPQDARVAPRIDQLTERLRALGAPAVSEIVDLPLRGSALARVGFDLEPVLEQTAGHYLVGLRRLDGSTERHWMRLQVSDLAVTVVEEAHRAVFAVTSLDTAEPVVGATLRIEGLTSAAPNPPLALEELWRGVTDARGLAIFQAPGPKDAQVRRLVIEHRGDLLVLDAARPPDRFADGAWLESDETWLQWGFARTTWRGRQVEERVHLFTERPVYRPEEPVHVGAILRTADGEGGLRIDGWSGDLVIEGPGGRVWRHAVSATVADGWITHTFDADDTPAGVYRAWLEPARSTRRLGGVTFRKEAYRLPRFEVLLDAPRRVPLDEPFDVRATASYYAGGRVAERPVRWRVTQFPEVYRPESGPGATDAYDGFVWSSDGRYSRTESFRSTPAVESLDTTDAEGGAVLAIDPTVEPTAQPRAYVVEATVTGADDQTVTTTRRVVALPPFVLGLDLPRYLEAGAVLAPRIVALDPVATDGAARAGVELTVRLLHRQWHSHLQASDFSDGVARYVTDVVDEPVFEQTLDSADRPVSLELPTTAPGVYVVEVSARDRLGRAQVVAVDLYAASGNESLDAVSWAKPAMPVLAVSTDAASYRPGDTARLVLESPFQEARALVAVEAPDGVRYSWHAVRGGEAVIELEVEGRWAPRIPVQVALLRGRLDGVAPRQGNAVDLGRPTMLAATVWLDVEPVDRRVEVTLEHPPEALPGQEVDVTIRLATPDGAPVAGTVALWLVDRAVLALGDEQRLDPLPTFVRPPASYVSLRDTRGMVFGELPWAELPGGGEGAESKGLLDRQTVRRNFDPVPYFERLDVDAAGVRTVRVPLSDSLTTFAVRAKATSGGERFGFARSALDVRLPVLVQPALPRFVRPGDRFAASAVARLVSGPAGPARAEIAADGLTLEGQSTLELELARERASRLDVPVRVPDEASGDVLVRVGVERVADGAGDAFEVRLPVQADRDETVQRELVTLEPGASWRWPGVDEPVRPGTLQRALLASDRPPLLAALVGLDALLEYPYGCTEQRVSRARGLLALRRLGDALELETGADSSGPAERHVEDTLAFLERVTDASGLVAFWPGGRGYVALTAWVAELEAEAKAAGFALDDELAARHLRALEQALRSDYGGFVDGASWLERTMALRALARAGRVSEAYAAELARRADTLGPAGIARVVQTLQGAGDDAVARELVDDLWGAVVVRRVDGEQVFGGLVSGSVARQPLILPSETRTLGEIVRAVHRQTPDDPRLDLLIDALVRLGAGDGWGDTQSDAAALLALAEVLEPQSGGADSAATLAVRPADAAADPASTADLTLHGGVARWRGTTDGALELTHGEGAAAGDRLLALTASTRFVPATPGARLGGESRGFVVERRLEVLDAGDGASRKVSLEAPTTIELAVGDVVEDHLRLVNPEQRVFVAVVVPLAAGVEPLNPALATAPPEAAPSAAPTIEPTYVEMLDDRVAYYFDVLPKGSFDLRHRVRASVAGSFTQPPATAELMYDRATRGRSAGARVEIGSGADRSEAP